MREIKFRAWDKENKEMLEVENLHFDEYHNNEMTIRTTMYNDYFDTEDMILMQYTGLHDKNGKEIYEGDIVDNGYNNIGVVKYGEYNCSCCEGVYGWYVDGGDIRQAECFLEVIGNIYENPDLLKGEENG